VTPESEGLQLPRAEYACQLAADRFWRDERRRLLGTHPDFPDAADLLEAEEEVAHALVLVLSRLPEGQRRVFADAFYFGRPQWHRDSWRPRAEPEDSQALAASVALLIVDLAEPNDLASEWIVDLLTGAVQGDDLARTPEAVVTELHRTLARTRLEVEAKDIADPGAAAATAVLEVLAPSSEAVALQEVVARAAFAAVERWDSRPVLTFLRDVDRAFAARRPRY